MYTSLHMQTLMHSHIYTFVQALFISMRHVQEAFRVVRGDAIWIFQIPKYPAQCLLI